MLKETDLYPPVKAYLNNLGYRVKAEVNHCDVVAGRGDEELIIVELKTRLNLELILQAAERLKLSDRVYIAFPANTSLWKRQWRRVRNLCKRLGLGIITVDTLKGSALFRLEPTQYKPRGSAKGKKRLQLEFKKRVGDHNTAGSSKKKIVTAYKQDALRCLAVIKKEQIPLATIREKSRLKRAAGILQKNYYGWFERVKRGHYRLSAAGLQALKEYSQIIEDIREFDDYKRGVERKAGKGERRKGKA